MSHVQGTTDQIDDICISEKWQPVIVDNMHNRWVANILLEFNPMQKLKSLFG